MTKLLNNKLFNSFFVLCFIVNLKFSFAQNPICKRFFDENNGITGAIYDVFQDKKGFIWLGTENGLSRFDGKKIVFFVFPKNYAKSVTNLFQDANDNIYCQNFSGHFFKKVWNNDTLKVVTAISKFGNIKQGNIVNDSLIGCFSKQGINFYNFKKNKIQITIPLSTELQPTTNKDKADNYTIIDPNKKTLTFYYPNGKRTIKPFESSNVVFYHVNFQNHNLIFGKRPPYFIEDLESGRIIPLKEINTNAIINHLSVLDKNYLAVLTSNGAYIYDKDYKLIRHIFKQESVSSVLLDQQKNWWFGTLNKGLILISQPQTISYLNEIGFKSIAFKNSNLIIGSRTNEIFELDVYNNKSKLLYKDSAIHDVRKLHYNKNTEEIVFSNQHLNFLKNGKLTRAIISVNDIYQIGEEKYILSEGSNVSIYPVSQEDTLYKIFKRPTINCNIKRLALSEVNLRVKESVMLGNNKIFSVTSRGLICFNGTILNELQYNNERIKAVSLAKINEDSLLIATSLNGVLLFTKGRIHEYIEQAAIQDNEIYMMKLFEGKIYIVTNNSLFVFDLNKRKLMEQYLSDGYHGFDLIDFVCKNDTMYALGVSGVLASPLTQYTKNDKPPPIILTDAKVNGRTFNTAVPQEFVYNSYFFEFNFCVFDYRGIETTKAYYKVNDGNWIEASDNKVLLTALEPNTYKIQVKAVNERGLESNVPVLISFQIKPPFYRTIWFISVVFLILLGLAFLMFKARLKTISKQSVLVNQKIELEKALRNSTLSGIKAQMNPHFIFNALNTIQSYIYLNDKKAAGDYLVSFSELMRSILEMSTKDYIQLSEELKALHLYLKLEKMRFEEEFNYTINVADNVEESFRIPSMLIQPYVENAIKHGLLHKKGSKKLEISFYKSNSSLIAEVVDNGIGVEASLKLNAIRSKKHNSFATQANRIRLELLNANAKEIIAVQNTTLKNESEQVVGTKVTISIPSGL